MMGRLLDSPEAWLAVGVSVLFLVTGLVMHRIFVTILKNGSREPMRHD